MTTIEDLPVEIKYVGEVDSPWDAAPCRVDQWQVTIKGWSIPYYTGLGCRSEPKIKPRYDGARPPRYGTLAYETMMREVDATRKPVKPTIANVLRSLMLDSDAGSESFNDFCSNFGYDNDSIKALNVYKACMDIHDNMRKVFDRKTLDDIRKATEDL
jgi:hypothetical protein